MLQIAVCDDDACFLKSAEKILVSYMEEMMLDAKIILFEHVAELEDYLKDTGNRLDLIFMDIELDTLNGIELAKKVNQERPKCKIAFLTNYLSYATDIYDVDHCYYVVKPEFEQRITGIFKNFFLGSGGKGIIVSAKGKNAIFEMKDICYIERGRRSCTIVTCDGEQKVSTYFEDICSQLEEPLFVQCHNSYTVNLNAVHIFRSNELTMKNGTVISVSRKYKDRVKQCFFKWQEVWL